MEQTESGNRRRAVPAEPTEREQYWRRVLDKLGKSGCATAAEYCRREGLSWNTVSWWKAEVRRREAARAVTAGEPIGSPPANPESSPTAKTPQKRRRRTNPAGQPRLIPVRLRAAVSPLSPAGVLVVLANQRTIRVERDFDADVLARLVRVLEGLPC